MSSERKPMLRPVTIPIAAVFEVTYDSMSAMTEEFKTFDSIEKEDCLRGHLEYHLAMFQNLIRTPEWNSKDWLSIRFVPHDEPQWDVPTELLSGD